MILLSDDTPCISTNKLHPQLQIPLRKIENAIIHKLTLAVLKSHLAYDRS